MSQRMHLGTILYESIRQVDVTGFLQYTSCVAPVPAILERLYLAFSVKIVWFGAGGELQMNGEDFLTTTFGVLPEGGHLALRKSIPMSEQDWYGKGFDALPVDGFRLIAVDNVLVPTWLLVYDLSASLEPELFTVDQLNPHGSTWEEVTGATAGHSRIAVMSTTASGWSSPKQHIALLDTGCLKEQAVVGTQRASYSQGPHD